MVWLHCVGYREPQKRAMVCTSPGASVELLCPDTLGPRSSS